MQLASSPCDSGSLHQEGLDRPSRRRVCQVEIADVQGKGEEGGLHLAQRHVQVVGKDQGQSASEPQVPPCHQANQNPCHHAGHPFGTTQRRRDRGWR